jgi:hypothetical protein
VKSRYTERKPVQCTCILSCEGVMGHGHLVDLSVPGCLLKTGMKLKVGQYLDMRLSFAASQHPLQIKLAAVRWVNGWEVGIEFIRMSEADQARLRGLAGAREKRAAQQNWSERVLCLGAATG